MPNRLSDETSPYLRQHGDNPVDWYPWGDDAFAARARLDRPVFLSVGLLVVPLVPRDGARVVRGPRDRRADERAVRQREGRPRGTTRRRRGLHAGGAGAHRSRRLAHERVVHAGRPSLLRRHLLPERGSARDAVVRHGVRGRRGGVARAARRGARARGPQLTEAIDEQVMRPRRAGRPRRPNCCARPTTTSSPQFEPNYGGFGRAPKFPQAMTLEFLCAPTTATRRRQTLEMITTTLDAMAAGGMYDQIGGGFARYSTDDYWLVPHFEKMLYDNALLTRAYLHAFLVTGEAAVPARRRGDDRVRAARPPPPRGRLLLRRGRRLRRDRRQVLPVDARRDRRRCAATTPTR